VKHAKVVKAGSVKIEPLNSDVFIEAKVKSDSMKKMTKKQIREIASSLGLAHDETMVTFTKKICNHIIQNAKER